MPEPASQQEPEPHGSHDGGDVITAREDGASADTLASVSSSVVSAARPQPVAAETRPSASKPRAGSSQPCSPFTPYTAAPGPSASSSQTPDTPTNPYTGPTFFRVFSSTTIMTVMICHDFILFFLDISSS